MPPNATTVEQDDPLLGQQVGEFRVERMLAVGGMGAVYVMRHVLLPNTRKVLKVILPKLVSMPHIRARFLAEADALSQLGNHPSIVGIDSHMTLPSGQLAIMMPFCEGAPLDEYVDRHGGKLSPHRAFYVACHVARGLHHAHMHGIVHRDLKPNNVFVEDDDNDWCKCKLLDFGIARRFNPNPDMPTHTHVGPCGTPEFMPPEQQDRAAEATSAADVYAFAVMIWWMVTGGYPWGPQSDPAILYVRKLNTPPIPPPENTLPAQWERWLRAALRPEPTERPTLRQLMHGLAQALPAAGRLVPSGPDILQKIARVLAEEIGPDDPTLRSLSNRTLQPPWPERDPAAPGAASAPSAPAAPPPSRPPTVNERAAVGAQPGAVASDPLQNVPGASAPAAQIAAVLEPVPAEVETRYDPTGRASAPGAAVVGPALDASPSAAAMGKRMSPAAPMALSPMTTTIGASSGAIASAPATPPKWKLALAGLMAVVVAGGGTFAVATLGGYRRTTEPAAAPRPLRTPAPAAPAAASAPPSATVSTSPAQSSGAAGSTAPVAATPAAGAAPPHPPATSPAATEPAAPAPAVPARSVAPTPALVKRRSGALPEPTSSATAKTRATARTPEPAGQDKASSDRNADRKFDPNAAVGGQED